MKPVLLLSVFITIYSSANAQDPQIQWQNTIGGNGVDDVQAMYTIPSGGFVLVGGSSSDASGDKTENAIGNNDVWVVKIDDNGQVEWDNTIGGTGSDLGKSVQPTSDGGFIIGAISDSDISGDKTENAIGGVDYWIIKLDASGNVVWDNTIGGTADDELHLVRQVPDGGYIVTGSSASDISGDKDENSIGLRDFWIMKLDSSGDIVWQNTIGGTDDEFATHVCRSADGGYIVGGSSFSDASGDKTENSNGGFDFWILKLDSVGNIVWQNSIGGSLNDFPESWIELSNQEIMIAGSSYSNISGDKSEASRGENDYWIVRLDPNGNVLWDRTYGGSSFDSTEAIWSNSDTQFLIFGSSRSDISGEKTEDSNGGSDGWTILIEDNGDLVWQNTIGGLGFEATRDGINSLELAHAVAFTSNSDISGDKDENTVGGTGEVDYWIVKLDNLLSASEAVSDFDLQVYPNPVTEIITVKSDQIDISNILIFNVEGKEVLSTSNINSRLIELDLSALPAGVYMMRLTGEGNTFSKKIIKQ